MDFKNTNKALILFFIMFFSTACNSTVPQDEPPMDFGPSTAGQMIKSTNLQKMDLAAGVIIYDVVYPGYNNLTSAAEVDSSSKAVLTETFAKKWKIVYEYDQQHSKYSQIPATFTIYGYSNSGNYDHLIDKYHFFQHKLGENTVIYEDDSGKSKIIDTVYFQIMD